MDNKQIDIKELLKRAKEDGWFLFLGQMFFLLCLVFSVRTFVFQPFTIPSGSMVPTLLVGDYISVTKYDYGYSRYSFPFPLPFLKGRIFESLPKHGDVVVFRFTQDTSIDYIKRVVGLPGDHIQLKHGTVYLNNVPLTRNFQGERDYPNREGRNWNGKEYWEETTNQESGKILKRDYRILQQTEYGAASNTAEYIVPPNCLFVMGDNRDDSSDSRFQGGREGGACATPLGSNYIAMSDHDLGFVPLENVEGKARTVLFSLDFEHPKWAFWYWPLEFRFDRFFHAIREKSEGK
ncbi:signal peptidase I [Acetobacteraceae bacterium]|nr:signal peptidase I [Acetobacteraceae bacterium]